ncbi:MAG: hypothetical protein IPH44_37350 [Myxococcales bacterium]|jgi:hypothetical protein|nr:hypothetical protein [Myxococcales bacterium]MBK7190939.1 hypothetical protein [Myxococcales bacterium]MBP6847825.1 hypothetical protein [Kofleriaceae bacterium]
MQQRLLALVTVLVPGLAYAQPTDAPPVDPATSDVVAEPPAPEAPPVDTQPAPEPAPPAADGHAISAKYDKGLTFETADGEYELKLGIRSQFRLEAARPDVAGTEFATRFSVPRLRLQLEGHAYGEANGYKVEFDMANKGFALLKDFFIDHAFAKDLHLRAGQWKRPFNRQEMVSDFGSEFLERSLANEFAGAGRDLGVAVHNNYEKSPEGLEWAVGVFNAASEKASIKTACLPGATPTDPLICTSGTPSNVPADFGPAIVVHAGWNHGGIKGYSEGDLEGGPLRYAVGLSYRMNPRDFDKDANDDLNIEHAVALDAMVKVEGLGISGAVILKKDGQADAEVGFYGQAGYMVVPKKILGALRFAQVPEDDEQRFEILGGVDYFLHGHNFKLMADGGVIHTTGADTSDLQLRAQLQAVL